MFKRLKSFFNSVFEILLPSDSLSDWLMFFAIFFITILVNEFFYCSIAYFISLKMAVYLSISTAVLSIYWVFSVVHNAEPLIKKLRGKTNC